jgi:hypothetical protein
MWRNLLRTEHAIKNCNEVPGLCQFSKRGFAFVLVYGFGHRTHKHLAVMNFFISSSGVAALTHGADLKRGVRWFGSKIVIVSQSASNGTTKLRRDSRNVQKQSGCLTQQDGSSPLSLPALRRDRVHQSDDIHLVSQEVAFRPFHPRTQMSWLIRACSKRT